jgi:GcrA cell cycle regulator
MLWLVIGGYHDMEWSDETIAQLRALWAEGHSTAEIGRRMGISKNAVVGKAHRLSLSSRPSPIRRGEPGTVARRTAPRRVTGPTLPPLRTAMTALPAMPRPAQPPVAEAPAPQQPVEARAPEPAPRPVLRPVPAPVRTGSLRPQPCCWPIGEPGTASFRFCDAEATAGKPYCSEHVQVAYVRIKDRREDAA